VRDRDGERIVEDTDGSALVVGRDITSLVAPEDSHLIADMPPVAGADAVLVEGGSALSRSLIAERLRLEGGIPSIILDDGLDDAAAATLILSGRADAVARTGAVRAIA
jgi:anthraniloyl-CoA monooxygenase